MKKTIDELISDYYNIFVGLPNDKKVVRESKHDDAFEIVVLETLYGDELDIDISSNGKKDLEKITKCIVPPPDSGVDIIVVHEQIDETFFDFIQVKNSKLGPSDIQKEMVYMEDSIDKFLKNPTNVHLHLREMLQTLDYTKNDKANSKFILVHRGDANYFQGQNEEKEQIVTGIELDALRNDSGKEIPSVSNFVIEKEGFYKSADVDFSEKHSALLVNIRGYELAQLATKYSQTIKGRSLLFGQNLRDGLEKSKTYDGMKKTIIEEPEKFWFYNNGITIIAGEYSVTEEKITLSDFSIINGAQTTSSLAKYMHEIEVNKPAEHKKEFIDKLKSVYILARIMKVPGNSEADKKFKRSITLFNNTQNEITTRDMVSNDKEQTDLQKRLISDEDPHIKLDIRRTTNKNNTDIHLYKHQSISNDTLAQLAFAGFLNDPASAKNKKKSLFDKTSEKKEDGTDYIINEYYDKIFDLNDGVLAKKSKEEINELLFVFSLYRESKKLIAADCKNFINANNEIINTSTDENAINDAKNNKDIYEKKKSLANASVFFCLDYYYLVKSVFVGIDKDKDYKYKDFYSSESTYKQELLKAFRNVFLEPTMDVISELLGSKSVADWIRSAKANTPVFNSKVKNMLVSRSKLKDEYVEYIAKFEE